MSEDGVAGESREIEFWEAAISRESLHSPLQAKAIVHLKVLEALLYINDS
jgi:hypothetical protein